MVLQVGGRPVACAILSECAGKVKRQRPDGAPKWQDREHNQGTSNHATSTPLCDRSKAAWPAANASGVIGAIARTAWPLPANPITSWDIEMAAPPGSGVSGPTNRMSIGGSGRLAIERLATLLGLARAPEARCHPFFGAHPYALAHAPPISIARSLSLSRSVWRKGSTACW